jgi:hypothetical protein
VIVGIDFRPGGSTRSTPRTAPRPS